MVPMMSNSEFEESDDPRLDPTPGVGAGTAKTWPIRSGEARQWKHHADTRRYLAIAIIGATLLLYMILVLAVIFGGIEEGDFVKVVAALSPLQSLAAATVGFFFARAGKN